MVLRTSSIVYTQRKRADVGVIPTELPLVNPLTPGCQALVLAGSKQGTTITCIQHIGVPDSKEYGFVTSHDCWEISPKLPWARHTDPTKTLMLSLFPTQYLMRIDGHEADASDQVQKVLEKTE